VSPSAGDILAYYVFLTNKSAKDAAQQLASRLVQVALHKSGRSLTRAEVTEHVEGLVSSALLDEGTLGQAIQECVSEGVVREVGGRCRLTSRAAFALSGSLQKASSARAKLHASIAACVREVDPYADGTRVNEACDIVESGLLEALHEAGLCAANIASGTRVDVNWEWHRADRIQGRLAKVVKGETAAWGILDGVARSVRNSESAQAFMTSALRTVYAMQILGLDPRLVRMKDEYLRKRVIYLDTSVLEEIAFNPAADKIRNTVGAASRAGMSLRVTSDTCAEWEQQFEDARRDVEKGRKDPGLIGRYFRETGVKDWSHFESTYVPGGRYMRSRGFCVETSLDLDPKDCGLGESVRRMEALKRSRAKSVRISLNQQLLRHDIVDLCHVHDQRTRAKRDGLGEQIWYLTIDIAIWRTHPSLALVPHELAALLAVGGTPGSEIAFVGAIVDSIVPIGSDENMDLVVAALIRSSGLDVHGLSGLPAGDVERLVADQIAVSRAEVAAGGDTSVMFDIYYQLERYEAALRKEMRRVKALEAELAHVKSLNWSRRVGRFLLDWWAALAAALRRVLHKD